MTAPATRPPLTRAQKNARFALRVAWLLTKGFALGLMTAIALTAVVLFTLPKVVNGDRVRGMLVERLTEVLHRKVEIDGLVLTLQGVRLQGVRIYDRVDPQRKLLESDYALLTFKLRPLFEDRRIELNHVKLGSPKIRVWRGEDGQWSFSDVFSSSGAAGAGRLDLPVSLAADRTDIENGSLEVDDKLRNTSFLVDKFNLSVDRFSIDKPFRYRLSFDNVNRFGDRRLDASLSLDGSMCLSSFNWFEAYARAERFDLKVGGREIRGSGGVTGFPQASVDLDFMVPPLSADDFQQLAGRPVDFAFPGSRWRLKAVFLQPRLAKIDDLEVHAGALAATSSGTVDWTHDSPVVDGELSVSDFPLDQAASFRSGWDGYDLQGTARLQAAVHATGERLVVRKAQLEARGFGALLAHAKIEGADFSLGELDDFAKTTLSASRGSVFAFSNAFTGVAGSLSLHKGDLVLDRLKTRWQGSRLTLRGRVVDVSNPKKITVAGSLDQLKWESAESLVSGILSVVSSSTRPVVAASSDDGGTPWVRTFKYVIPKKFPDTIGHIHIGDTTHKDFYFKNMDLLWDLRGVTPSLRQANGDVRISFGPGRVNDIQALQSYHKFLKIVFLPYVYMNKMNNLSVLSAATAYPKTLDFNRIEGQYNIDHGVVLTRFTHIDSPQLVAFAAGKADFGRENVDMNILTRLTNYRAPLPEWWVDELGRPAIGFRVKGDLNQPELEPRLHKIPANEIEKDLDEARGRADARFESIEKLETGEEK